MKRIVRAMPAARSVLIAGLAAAYAGLSDDFPEVRCSVWRVVCVTGCLRVCFCICTSYIPRVRAPGQTACCLQQLWLFVCRKEQAVQVVYHWCMQVLWRVAGTLVELMDEWRTLLAGATAGKAPAEAAVSAGMKIARVEGFAFSILCHRDALVSPTVCTVWPNPLQPSVVRPVCSRLPCQRPLMVLID